VLGYSGLIGLMPMAARALASTLGSGATAAFDYCLRILGVPLALLVTPLSSSLLAEITRLRRLGDEDGAGAVIRKAAGWAVLASAAAAALLLVMGPRLVAAAFERGRFDAASTAMVSSMLAGLAPALIAWSVLDVISRSLFPLGKLVPPLLAAALALTVTCALSIAVPAPAVRWVGVPVTIGFLTGAVVVASQVWRIGRARGRP
jgi:putative peptidoglycan lipid II flippase